MSKIRWYVRPVIATEAGPDWKCANPFVAPIAVKEKRLFSRRDDADIPRRAFASDNTFDMLEGSNGRGGTM